MRLAGQHELLRGQGTCDGRLQPREERAIPDSGAPTPILENRENGGDDTAERDVLPSCYQLKMVKLDVSSLTRLHNKSLAEFLASAVGIATSPEALQSQLRASATIAREARLRKSPVRCSDTLRVHVAMAILGCSDTCDRGIRGVRPSPFPLR